MVDDWQWRNRAACREVDTKVFFKLRTEDAKRICAKCPVRKPCLEFALQEVDAGQAPKLVCRLGVWGGLSGEERLQLRKGK